MANKPDDLMGAACILAYLMDNSCWMNDLQLNLANCFWFQQNYPCCVILLICLLQHQKDPALPIGATQHNTTPCLALSRLDYCNALLAGFPARPKLTASDLCVLQKLVFCKCYAIIPKRQNHFH